MNTSETLGSWGGQSSGPCEYLTLGFSPLSAPLRSRWRNNGLSADFLSDYVTTFLPRSGDLATAENIQGQIRHAVSYVANELLENAMKYHDNTVDIPITIDMKLTTDQITISASNGLNGGQAEHYKTFVQALLAEDPGELFMRRLENAGNADSNVSGLGLLTMINDYGAELGWRFDIHPDATDIVTATTSVFLQLNNIPGYKAS